MNFAASLMPPFFILNKPFKNLCDDSLLVVLESWILEGRISFMYSIIRSRIFVSAFFIVSIISCSVSAQENRGESRSPRSIMTELILSESSAHKTLVAELEAYGDPVITEIYQAWRKGGIYSVESENGVIVVQAIPGKKWILLETGESIALSSEQIDQAIKKRPARKLRKSLKSLIDTLGLKAENPEDRIDAARKMGLSQKKEFILALEARMKVDTDNDVRLAIRESLAISLLANGDSAQILESVVALGEFKSIPSRDFIQKLLDQEQEALRNDSDLAVASEVSLRQIQYRVKSLERWGNLFRGLSLGSVLLIVSFGLAITFGLMGVINMAHGEFVAIGGYTTYLIQNFFIDQWGIDSGAFGWYFVISLPLSFLVAAAIGFVIEKSIIQFLYRRPLESLLCTWGLSMVMQQSFRLIFGAANVQVNTPAWLLGHWNLGILSMSYTRLFILFIAIVVILLTWLLLRKTNLGLHIRAVMQNRNMASSIGIPVDRVNSMTFALGCGLAALGGSVLSQIGNVGPSMGQAYIVDCFMVVVIGSVGNLLGAGISAMGIGLVDQFLQPALGPVMGKITVFSMIILFLQWRPGGLFPTKSRSLED